MSLEKIVEEKIKKAMSEGEFDNLQGVGKTLNLDAYFNTPEDIRASYSLLNSNNFVREEVEILRETVFLKKKLQTCKDEQNRQKLNKELNKELNEKTLAFSILRERNKLK